VVFESLNIIILCVHLKYLKNYRYLFGFLIYHVSHDTINLIHAYNIGKKEKKGIQIFARYLSSTKSN